MTPQDRDRLNGIRRCVIAARAVKDDPEYKPGICDVIEFLLELVPPGVDAQIDSVEEQKIVDQQRIKQAEKIIGSPTSVEEAIKLAVNWCATAMQEDLQR